VVVNPANNLDVLALRAAPEITDDELDTQLEIGELYKRIGLHMLPLLVIEGCRIHRPES